MSEETETTDDEATDNLEHELAGSILWNQIAPEIKRACGAERPVVCVFDELAFRIWGSAAQIVIEFELSGLYTITLLDRRKSLARELTRVEGVTLDTLNSVLCALIGVAH